ncbi:MAG: very short patch repair endonuclease [Bryobacterales bacterium]|nr:very short patch repair endonuclease [Bryobacterales bacterium]
MTDWLTVEQRRRVMQAVKGKDTGPELTVRRIVHRLGYRYRLHKKDLPGRPDLVFGPRKKVIFVHGCFWHAHNCRYGRMPESRQEYWVPKLIGNMERDKANVAKLEAMGWEVLTVWECEVKRTAELVDRLTEFLDEEQGLRAKGDEDVA